MPILNEHHLYSVYFAPRGYVRMSQMGRQIAQRHLTSFDRLIGVLGEAGSGKSLLIRGMFPGLELTNDDDGVNVRPLPILDIGEGGFYQPHTYHLDVRFEMAFTQPHELADAIRMALDKGKRVIVEHFDLIYPLLGVNAELLIGIGEEIVVTRPSIFGPEPGDITNVVFKTNRFRRMAHSAEDLAERYLHKEFAGMYRHEDVRHGFILEFDKKPAVDVAALENYVLKKISQDLPISFVDDNHIRIGEKLHGCTGPRMHMARTGEIENFRVLPDIKYDPLSEKFMLVGLIGPSNGYDARDLNAIHMA